MISINIGDTESLILWVGVSIWLAGNGIASLIRVRLFWLERKLIREQKLQGGRE